MIVLGLLLKPQANDGAQIFEDLMGECDGRNFKPNIESEEVALPNQQCLRLVGDLALLDRIEKMGNVKNMARCGEISVEYPPKARGDNAEIMGKKAILNQHAGMQLKDAYNLSQERLEFLVVGPRPARELNLAIEFLMPDERADDTTGRAKPTIWHNMDDQQDVRYKHYALVGRGASHLAPGPQDMLQIISERMARRLSEWRTRRCRTCARPAPPPCPSTRSTGSSSSSPSGSPTPQASNAP